MTKKILTWVLLFVLIGIILPFLVNNSKAQTCYNNNITLTNSSKFVCTSEWVNVINPVDLYNVTLIAKGIIINNTFELKGNSSVNISDIINNANFTLDSDLSNGEVFINSGTVFMEKPVFLNFSYFFNKGEIYDQNYIGNGGNSLGYSKGEGGSFPHSYAGSGGASIQNNSANDGGRTLAEPGQAYVLCHLNGCGDTSGVSKESLAVEGNHVNSTLSNYTFNLSLLNSAGGADFNAVGNNLVNGGSGVFPLIIISERFENHGLISDKGQSINYSAIPYGKEALQAGIVGAGGGGVVEVISKTQ